MDNQVYQQVTGKVAEFRANVDRSFLPITWKNTENMVLIPSPFISKEIPI
jgi:hypothetical protein